MPSQPAIFDDIAQAAVNLCKQSLVSASDSLKSKNPPSSVLDGQLFLVRHLLILKEMTQNLDFATKDSDRTLDLTGVVFDEADAEAEADPEDELDTPIAEANEDDAEAEGEFTSYLPTSPG